MTFELQWLFYGVVLVVGVLLLARFGKVLLGVGLLLGVLVLIGALGAQATATRQVATAATVSAAGQTANSVAVTVLALVWGVTLLLALALSLYFWLRLRRAERQAPAAGPWLAGPPAQWGRETAPPGAGLEQTLSALVQLELLRTLRSWRGTGVSDAGVSPLPAAEEEVANGSFFWPEW